MAAQQNYQCLAASALEPFKIIIDKSVYLVA